MGGVAGFIGTFLIGPRIGLFHKDKILEYLLDDDLLYDDTFLRFHQEQRKDDDGNHIVEEREVEDTIPTSLYNFNSQKMEEINNMVDKVAKRFSDNEKSQACREDLIS
jgi:hypothetical protein